MRRSFPALGAIGALWLAVACLDIASPVSGIASITSVVLPTPSVVVGDTSRDTTGAVDSLRVFAFAPNGDTVRDVTVRFFAIDTTRGLRVDSVRGLAYGDSLSPLANVVARITPANGKGVIQTLLVPLPVVPRPVAVTKGDTIINFPFDAATTDSLGTTLLSPALGVTVHGNADTTIQSYVVSYNITRRPASKDGKPSVVIFDRSGNDSTVAITAAGGLASRQLRVRVPSIPDVLRNLGATDTVVVHVNVRYRRNSLTITPSDSFVIVLRSSILR
jgi:hypothetical protein